MISMDPSDSSYCSGRAVGPGLAFIAGGEVGTVSSIDLDYGIGRAGAQSCIHRRRRS